jgi:hypothetical protein
MKPYLPLLAAGLAASPVAAQAAELPDNTPTRPITIAPKNSPMGDKRIIFSKQILSMKDCRDALPEMLNGLTKEDDGIIYACLPADLTVLQEGVIYPMVQYTAK